MAEIVKITCDACGEPIGRFARTRVRWAHSLLPRRGVDLCPKHGLALADAMESLLRPAQPTRTTRSAATAGKRVQSKPARAARKPKPSPKSPARRA